MYKLSEYERGYKDGWEEGYEKVCEDEWEAHQEVMRKNGISLHETLRRERR